MQLRPKPRSVRSPTRASEPQAPARIARGVKQGTNGVQMTVWSAIVVPVPLLARFPASQVAPFSQLVPLVGVLSAWLVLGDRPTVPEVIGGALLLLGVAVTTGVLKTIARNISGTNRRKRQVIASEKPEVEHSSTSG